MALDAPLEAAIRTLHVRGGWVPLATVSKDGGPHVTPVMMGVHDRGLLFSLTGRVKKANLRRDPRACIELSRPGDYASVIVWGTMAVREDPEALELWRWLISDQLGAEALNHLPKNLGSEGTSLGIFDPTHYRISGL